MEYFKKYVSNTYAGSGNHLYFRIPEGETRTGRIFYKISVSGEYDYSVLFSNIIDSTYSDGSVSHKNLICGQWEIHSARIGKCKTIDEGKKLSDMTLADADEECGADITVFDLKEITFGGQGSKRVMPGEFFASDAIRLGFDADEYLCLEITFSGEMIPHHEQSLLPVFIKDGGEWKYSKHMPFAAMIGCDRQVKGRIAFLGDSITQGIGTPPNSYSHWNAVLSRRLGDEYAFWNLGLGFGRASDAASDGAWLYKAKQNDLVFVCFGVNDILQGASEEQIKSDLTSIVDILKRAGIKVVLQTVPPFGYAGEKIEKWKRINTYIKTVLKDRVDALFDNVPYLSPAEYPHRAKFGGHPNEEGCRIWAEALFDEIGDFLKHSFEA